MSSISSNKSKPTMTKENANPNEVTPLLSTQHGEMPPTSPDLERGADSNAVPNLQSNTSGSETRSAFARVSSREATDTSIPSLVNTDEKDKDTRETSPITTQGEAGSSTADAHQASTEENRPSDQFNWLDIRHCVALSAAVSRIVSLFHNPDPLAVVGTSFSTASMAVAYGLQVNNMKEIKNDQKEMNKKMDKLDENFDEMKEKFDEMKEKFDEMKEMLEKVLNKSKKEEE